MGMLISVISAIIWMTKYIKYQIIHMKDTQYLFVSCTLMKWEK